MSAPAGADTASIDTPSIDLASIPARIQLEVERAIQRSIKGVEYFFLPVPRSE